MNTNIDGSSERQEPYFTTDDDELTVSAKEPELNSIEPTPELQRSSETVVKTNVAPLIEGQDKLGLSKEAANDAVTLEARREAEAAELAELLKRKFNIAGNEYHFKDKTDPKLSLAFVDKDSVLKTKHNDPEVIDAMLKVATTKGWDKLTLKGSEEFKREAWIKASAQGFEVTGYKPTEIDITRMRQERDALQKNQVGGTVAEGEISGINSNNKNSGGIDQEKLKAYTESKDFSSTLEKIEADLKNHGYPVDERFKDAIRKHMIDEFSQGRKFEKGIEIVKPVERVIEPARMAEQDRSLERKTVEIGDRSR
ncbi:MAG TPA: LPD7 domain-containing protein [Methylobacter sp.]|jgi:hypothetical protein